MTDEALELDLGLADQVHAELERSGIYTAERFKVRRPEAYRICVELLREQVSASKIRQLLKVDIRTVNAVLAELQDSGSITPYKTRTVKQMEALITLGLEELLAAATHHDPEMRRHLSPLELAILMDKRELLAGGVTRRVELIEDADAVALRLLLSGGAPSLRAPGMVIEMVNLPQMAGEIGAANVIDLQVAEEPKE